PLPGLLRDVMGVTVSDYVPIYSPGQKVKFASALAGEDAEVSLWADILQPQTAEVLGTYTSGGHAGEAAITVNRFGKGRAVYIGAGLHPADLARVLGKLKAGAGLKPLLNAPAGFEITSRKSGNRRWIFVLNHNPAAQTVTLPSGSKDAITGEVHNGATQVRGYGVLALETG